jgi:hypothetical protein
MNKVPGFAALRGGIKRCEATGNSSQALMFLAADNYTGELAKTSKAGWLSMALPSSLKIAVLSE